MKDIELYRKEKDDVDCAICGSPLPGIYILRLGGIEINLCEECVQYLKKEVNSEGA